ncbi:hypothetical protein [Pseudomonas sp. BR1R-5]|uniref:hypothetical protein n=1 Tax=Pseudomonas sp. BR1R-5 TaxID=3003626 RepID=UPI0024918C05|nr:hypothetical protein [Pseudomonas sp. BR1R-5]
MQKRRLSQKKNESETLPNLPKICCLNTVALKNGGGQPMMKTALKTIVRDVVIAVLSAYIVALLQAGDQPKSDTDRQPRVMYVQHQEPAYAGDQVLVRI